jgi:hypothetical protein
MEVPRVKEGDNPIPSDPKGVNFKGPRSVPSIKRGV